MKAIKITALLLAVILLLCSCGNNETDTEQANESTGENSSIAEIPEDTSDMFTDRDCDSSFDESQSISIKLNGSSAQSSSDAVKISGGNITISHEGTYVVSGTLSDGSVIVDAEDTAKIQIVLNSADITSKTSAPIYVKEADKVFITLNKDTQNSLTNGGSYTAVDDNNIDSVIFSKSDLTLNGNGSLTVTSPAGHGIASKDDLVITQGSYTVTSASHGIDANDSVRIKEASITVETGKDGIHSENADDSTLGFVYIASGQFDIEAEGDGISAESYMQIENGTVNILAGGGSENGTKKSSDSWGDFGGMGGGMKGGPGGGRGMGYTPSATPTAMSTTDSSDESSTSMKGLKSAGNMLISNGTFTIDSADDSLHSNASITVNGGTFEIKSGDDAVHAEEKLNITEGTINITESYEGLEALNINIQGGNIKLVASDDGLNAAGGTDSSGTTGGRDGMFGGPGGMGGGSSNGSIKVSDGTLYINSSGDGMDANGTLEISGGHTTIVGPTQGDTATLDYDTSGIITGGTFIGTGASGMAQTFSDSEQGVIAVSVGNQSAGTAITLKTKSGDTLISYKPELDFAVVILSSPDIKSGESYTITVGSLTEEFEAS